MAVQMALNDDWDIYLDANGDLALVEDGNEVVQHVKQRLDFQQGEWFLDESIGVPWLTDILGQSFLATNDPNRAFAESIIKETILSTPGVTRLVTFSADFDPVNRAGTYRFNFDTAWGDGGSEYFTTTIGQ